MSDPSIVYLWDERIKQIERIDFGILSNAEKKAISSTNIDLSNLCENSKPKYSDLSEMRIGYTSIKRKLHDKSNSRLNKNN